MKKIILVDDGEPIEGVASSEDFGHALGFLTQRLDRIERVLIAQLEDQRARLAGELAYRSGSGRPTQSIRDRLATVTQHLEDLTG